MKQFISKVQNLSQKAAQLQEKLHSVPPKITRIRESVAATAGQIQQLRTSLQSSVSDLRVEHPNHLIEALQEVHDHAEVFAEAGYQLTGVDMELSPTHRLMVHLDKCDNIAHAHIRTLMAANRERKTVHALLLSLLQADEAADRVVLEDLSYRTLIVHVGPVPSVRLCWRIKDEEALAETNVSTAASTPPPSTTSGPASASTSLFSQSSYFEPRTPMPTTAQPQPAPPSSQIELPSDAPQTPAAPSAALPSASAIQTSMASKDWKQVALERLKKNPHASKYQR